MVRLTVAGDSLLRVEDRPLVARSTIGGDFLPTMRIPLTRGRSFSAAETSARAAVAMINTEAARRFWPGRDPLGARIALDAVVGQERWLEIVGVVGDVRNSDLD